MTRKERSNHVRALAAILNDHEHEHDVLMTLAGALNHETDLASLAAVVRNWRNQVGVPRAVTRSLRRLRS